MTRFRGDKGREICRHESRAKNICRGGGKETLHQFEPGGEDVIREAIDQDDCHHCSQSAPIDIEIGAGIMDHLMGYVREKGRSSGKKPPIRERFSAVDISDAGRKSTERHHPQDHGRESQLACDRRRNSDLWGQIPLLRVQPLDSTAAARIIQVRHYGCLDTTKVSPTSMIA